MIRNKSYNLCFLLNWDKLKTLAISWSWFCYNYTTFHNTYTTLVVINHEHLCDVTLYIFCHISLAGVGYYSTSYNSFFWLLPLHLRQGQTSHSMEVTVILLTYSEVSVKQPSYCLRWFGLALRFLNFCKLNMFQNVSTCMAAYPLLACQNLMLHNESRCMHACEL